MDKDDDEEASQFVFLRAETNSVDGCSSKKSGKNAAQSPSVGPNPCQQISVVYPFCLSPSAPKYTPRIMDRPQRYIGMATSQDHRKGCGDNSWPSPLFQTDHHSLYSDLSVFPVINCRELPLPTTLTSLPFSLQSRRSLSLTNRSLMGGGLKLQTISYEPAKEESMVEMGPEKYGCSHYHRRCKIVAPCCNEIFDCRHCHNDAKNSLEVDPLDRHDIPRHELKRVICSLCNTEQDVQQICNNCGVCLGKYYCSKCKFFDDDVSKNHYHCDKCGICRTGGKENFFHCNKCGCCYSNLLKDSHVCIERAMHHNCPICFEYLFDTPRDTTVLPCGHTIHLDCVKEMERRFQYSCPVCLKSYCDMTRVWERLDEEIAATPMPQIYQNKMVWILCNDCGEISEVNFHILANKCMHCKSYNTRQTRGGHASTCTSGIPEVVR